MIDVYRVPFPKERLREFSTDERSLFILLGYAANQIAVFRKLVVFATNGPNHERHVLAMVEGAQTQILVRQFVGIVSEAWELVSKRFIKRPIGKEYQDRLDPRGKEALANLKSHFGGSNILNKVRNQFAFHHPYDEDIESGFEMAAGAAEFDNEWCWYLAQENTNSFYFVSDMVIANGMLGTMGEPTIIDAQKRLLKEVLYVADQYVLFASVCLQAILTKYFAPHIDATVCEKVSDAPVALDVLLPFYIEPPSDDRLMEEGLPTSLEGSSRA